MSIPTLPKVLISGATGQVGKKTIDFLQEKFSTTVEIVAAVRSPQKAELFTAMGISSVILDFDDEKTHLPAFQGIDRFFLVTGYTVDMLRQSKALLDAAKKAGVKHVVHLGACGPDDTTVAHWAWHQFVERYIEWCGFSYTHLRPEFFMQNLLGYGGKKAAENGVITHFLGQARASWVDVDDVALVAAIALSKPDKHKGQTYRMGYDAKSHDEIADLLTSGLNKPFTALALPQEVFLESVRAAGAEMAYMTCVYDHQKRYASFDIPGVEDTFDNFPVITGGQQPVRWEEFIQKHKAEFDY